MYNLKYFIAIAQDRLGKLINLPINIINRKEFKKEKSIKTKVAAILHKNILHGLKG